MKTTAVLFLLFFCVIGPLRGCVCFDIDSVSAKALIKEVEFVVIGRAKKNMGFIKEVNGIWDKENRGFDILFEVDSIVKGDLKSKSLIVKQFGGNCDQIFKFGEQYLVIGNKIERFVNKTPKQRKPKKGEIPEYPVPPPPPSIYSNKAVFYYSSQKEVNFWNNKAKKNLILNTSRCSSFSIDSTIARYFYEL